MAKKSPLRDRLTDLAEGRTRRLAEGVLDDLSALSAACFLAMEEADLLSEVLGIWLDRDADREDRALASEDAESAAQALIEHIDEITDALS